MARCEGVGVPLDGLGVLSPLDSLGALSHVETACRMENPTPTQGKVPAQLFFADLAAAASSFSRYFAGLALKRDSHLWQQKRTSRSGLPSCW